MQLQIYREAVQADASVQFIYTAVNLPHGQVMTITHASWIMKNQKYLIKHEFAVMHQVELYEFINSVHRSPLLADTGLPL